MIDFKKRLNQGASERKVNPVEIYDTIDRKSVTGPLRPAQKYILEKWYGEYKETRDLIIKLHTGEGKTLIGLLILQSRINSGHGPCLYICPNRYLVQQVCEEAHKFGVPFCSILDEREIPNDFLSGQKLLITHAQKLFNGMSIFGIGNRCVSADTVIMDDSHACIDVLKSAYTITIDKSKNEKLYCGLMELFEDSLRDQGEGSFIDVKTGNYDTLMAIPYWSWIDKKTEVLEMLSKNIDDNQIKFAWPLFKNSIEGYRCCITSNLIEISPYSTNVGVFGTFNNANHRILMSATTQDDSFFVKGLAFDINAVKNPLKNEQQKWSGEKMLILPSLIHDDCDRDLIITKFSKLKHSQFGIVAIAPSTKKAIQYKTLGATIADRSNIFNEIDKLKKGIFDNILVINNRYDGIDLPDEACRILIIDSMPYFENLADRYEESCRPNSEAISKRLAQKIEQGIGRGVRGEKDYCVLLIIGSDIVKFMRSIATNKYFSAQTRKQIEIGMSIAEMAQEDIQEDTSPIETVISLIKQSLGRDEGWKEYYSSEMDTISDTEVSLTVFEQLAKERDIEQLCNQGEYPKACDAMQAFIDELPPNDNLERGWYLQQLARYTYYISTERSNELQKAAFKLNTQLLKPREGIKYTRVSYINENRANRIRVFLNRFSSYQELQLSINALLDNLSFGVDSDKFEEALKEIGELLGFISQRPDKEIRKGPDNLWCGIDNQYFLFECKNKVDEDRSEINKHEAGQMNSHCGWFEEEYGKETVVSRFLIAPTRDLSYAANFTHTVRIIRKGKLKDFKTNIKKFINEIAPYTLSDISDETLLHFIKLHKLDLDDIQDYSENYFHKTR